MTSETASDLLFSLGSGGSVLVQDIRGHMSHDIPDRCLKTSATGRTAWFMSKSGASKARLVITAVTVENRTVAEVVADYGVSKSWVYELLARYRAEGEAAFEPRSRRPLTSPQATPAARRRADPADP